MNILIVKDLVTMILTENPQTRDDDNLLILKIYAEYEPGLRLPTFKFRTFAENFLKGKYPSTESIRRSRQKIQELHPELRGKNYKKRHQEQKNVVNQVKSFE